MEEQFNPLRKALIEQGLIKESRAANIQPDKQKDEAGEQTEWELSVARNDYVGALSMYCRAKGLSEPKYVIERIEGGKGYWCGVQIKRRGKVYGSQGIGSNPEEAKKNAAMNLLMDIRDWRKE